MDEAHDSLGKTASGTTCALLFAVALGCLVPLSKLLLASMTPLQLAAVLSLGAGIGVGAVFVVRKLAGKAGGYVPLERADAPNIVLSSALNAAAIALLTIGVSRVLATNASLLLGFEVAAAMAVAWVLARRHVCYKAMAAVLFICLSSALLCWNGRAEVVFAPEALLLMAASAFWALATHFDKKLVGKDPWGLVCVKELAAGVAICAMAIVVDGGLAIDSAALLEALALGFVSCGIGAVLLMMSWRAIGGARADGWASLAPFTGLVVSWSCFGLVLDPLLFGALAFMGLGVWLAMDDSVFHEDAFAMADHERAVLYEHDASVFEYDRMHRPLTDKSGR